MIGMPQMPNLNIPIQSSSSDAIQSDNIENGGNAGTKSEQIYGIAQSLSKETFGAEAIIPSSKINSDHTDKSNKRVESGKQLHRQYQSQLNLKTESQLIQKKPDKRNPQEKPS